MLLFDGVSMYVGVGVVDFMVSCGLKVEVVMFDVKVVDDCGGMMFLIFYCCLYVFGVILMLNMMFDCVYEENGKMIVVLCNEYIEELEECVVD